MTRADSVHSTPPLNTSATTPIAGLDWLDIKADASAHEIFRAIGRLRKEARNEIDRLIRFLDSTENYMELEDDGDLEHVGDDERSLGSFDRMVDQDKSWRQVSILAFPEIDGEVDDCYREDCDPDEHKQQPLKWEVRHDRKRHIALVGSGNTAAEVSLADVGRSRLRKLW